MVVFEGVAQRDQWRDLPLSVREAVADRLSGQVVSAVNQVGGFSHGMAAVLILADGRRAFAKAVRTDDGLAVLYRAEAATAQGLSSLVPTPTLLFTVEDNGWFVAVFEAVAGHHPRLDHPDELASVLALLDRMAQALTPSPRPGIPSVTEVYHSKLRCWSNFAGHGPPRDLDPWAVRNLDRLAGLEARWLDWAEGETLLHTDLRPDNLLVTTEGAVVVLDWGWPCRGAAWVDLVFMAPMIAGAGVDPDPILAEQPVTRDLDPVAVDSLLCAMAGYWAAQSRQPGPPRSPGLRAYQARAARTALLWFTSRIGWS